MFREDFEFHDGATPSHLGPTTTRPIQTPESTRADANTMIWAPEAEQELKKIPFFVRGKARRNTERFAEERGIQTITVETLYDAKAHFGR